MSLVRDQFRAAAAAAVLEAAPDRKFLEIGGSPTLISKILGKTFRSWRNISCECMTGEMLSRRNHSTVCGDSSKSYSS
jgi:hypothetical protein